MTKTPQVDRAPADKAPPASRYIVYFDGVCGLCNWSVDVLLRLDREQRLLFTPLQGETAAGNLAASDREDLQTLIFSEAVGSTTRLWRRSDAVLRALEICGGPIAAMACGLRVLPRWPRDLVYNLIARFRYRLFGQKSSCRIPSPAERSRFLP
ncbi:MAG TPA: DCC1-like thiol-disulfide oxidoreductase family protein [Pseudobdellovibrionaceae bacterium]|nr:DCC1-like thiol-disulfide oxidoreductase family protein [Pseudobdellovibrionaceae bacterium]